MKKIMLIVAATLISLILVINISAKGSEFGNYLVSKTGEYFGISANKRIIDSSLQSENVQSNNLASNRFSLENATFASSDGKRVIKVPDDLMVLVNKYRNLPYDWVPNDLVVPKVVFAFKEDSPRKLMRKEAAAALEKLFEQAQKEKIKIAAASGYRSAETQKRIFESNAKLYGQAEANKVSAIPGQSEHQTGLAMDITSASVNFGLEEAFENTPEGKWLRENAPKFGFIIRYPKGKENITKYSYEPWHVRYVGTETANTITRMAVTLEEYLDAVD